MPIVFRLGDSFLQDVYEGFVKRFYLAVNLGVIGKGSFVGYLKSLIKFIHFLITNGVPLSVTKTLGTQNQQIIC